MVPGLDKRNPRLACEDVGHSGAEAWMRVDAGADRGASRRQLQDGGQGALRPFQGQLGLPGVAAEFLSQPDRRGISQVGTADLDNVVPLLRLLR